MRTNWRNTGKLFEREIEGVLVQYRAKRFLDLRKTEPATRFIEGQVLHLRNDWLDYAGSWTERGGRCVVMECKSTTPEQHLEGMEREPRLPLGSGGLTDRQRLAMLRWTDAGACAFLLWRHGTRTLFVPWPVIYTVDRRMDRRHLLWSDGREVKQGMGFVTCDFLEAMRTCWPGKASAI